MYGLDDADIRDAVETYLISILFMNYPGLKKSLYSESFLPKYSQRSLSAHQCNRYLFAINTNDIIATTEVVKARR